MGATHASTQWRAASLAQQHIISDGSGLGWRAQFLSEIDRRIFIQTVQSLAGGFAVGRLTAIGWRGDSRPWCYDTKFLDGRRAQCQVCMHTSSSAQVSVALRKGRLRHIMPRLPNWGRSSLVLELAVASYLRHF